jgi:hypothetical protein
VVQSLVDLPVHEFPRLDGAGRVHREPYFCVMGFAPAGGELAILGRASPRQVVNVAQRGGLCAVVVGEGSVKQRLPRNSARTAPTRPRTSGKRFMR